MHPRSNAAGIFSGFADTDAELVGVEPAGGAAVGAAIGAITGSAGRGAGIGAVTGGAESARISERERANVVSNCLRGRGYRVLN